MKNIFKKFSQIVDSFDWKKQYINQSEDLVDLERRMKSLEEFEQKQAQIRARCKI